MVWVHPSGSNIAEISLSWSQFEPLAEESAEISAHAIEAFSEGSVLALGNRTWVLGQVLALTDFVTRGKPHEAQFTHLESEKEVGPIFWDSQED